MVAVGGAEITANYNDLNDPTWDRGTLTQYDIGVVLQEKLACVPRGLSKNYLRGRGMTSIFSRVQATL